MSNLKELLRCLERERTELRAALATLQRLYAIRTARPTNPGRIETRGRKSMGLEERKQVSERMRKYWASQRNAEYKSKVAAGIPPCGPTS